MHHGRIELPGQSHMIYLGFPYGSNFGWGVLGKEVALAMAQLTDVRVLCPPNADQRLDDEFDRFRFQKLLTTLPQQAGTLWQMDAPVIQAAIGLTLEPFVPHIAPPAQLGYAVFEENHLPTPIIDQARRQYQRLAAGSSYCAEVLRRHGWTDVAVIPHGVDTTVFCPRSEPRRFMPDRFILFSGGKFELRKGQDIVIRAYKVLQDRHRDVMLVNFWYNNWPKTRDTMGASRLIRYLPPKDNQYIAWMNSLLACHGIDVERVITVGQRDHRLLPELYHNTDLGVFPNRVEGGNNMVLMEYMACGKPVLASYNSGHTDIIRRSNAVLIEAHRSLQHTGKELTLTMNDPSLDETIAKLEWCYQNRDQLQPLAQQAALDMRQFTWQRLAKSLLQAALPV